MGELSAVNLILFLSATFAASFVTGLAGFAFAIVAAAVWLHFLPPAQSTVLIAAFGLIVQGWAVWKLRRAIRPFRLAPFLIGAVIVVPLGAQFLRWTSPDSLRFGIGVVLVAFSLYSLIRPRLPTASEAGRFTDGMVGTLNGALGGATGFAGIILTIWCTLRGWPPPEQRAVFQPVGVFVFLLTALFLGGTRTIAPDTLSLFLIGLPAVALGTWAGLKLFGRLDETGSGAWFWCCCWPRASLSSCICGRRSRFGSQPYVTLICASAGGELERVGAAMTAFIEPPLPDCS